MRSLRKDFQDTSMYRKWVEDKRERTTELTTAKRVYENMYKERPEKNAHPRYIWFKVTRGEITIYVFRKAYLREECEREVKERKYKSWYESHKLTDDENAELDEMFDELTVVNGKEPLPDQYQRYEENPRRFENAQECIFYEMQEWVDGYNLVSDKYKALIYNDLCTLFVDHTKQPLQDKEFFVHKIDETPYTIVYRMDASNIATTSIYLIHIGEQVNMPSLREKRYDTPKISTLQRKAKKCYPDFILCSYEAWLGVEDDSQANLALSDEELRILQQIQYPFYVSGLAGSGKSTVLYYLFAHAYDFMAKHHPDQRMLFLSYSNKLVKNAKDIVKAILRYNPAYGIAEKEAFSDKEQENRFDGCFQPFQQFIRNEFLDEEELSIFAPDCYIDYQGFKTLYETCQLPEKKRYSPDIVWSVIRTYIKGR